jgi:hypothetical protein
MGGGQGLGWPRRNQHDGEKGCTLLMAVDEQPIKSLSGLCNPRLWHNPAHRFCQRHRP